METNDWKALWKSHQAQLDQNNRLHLMITRQMQQQSARRPLRRLWAARIAETLVWILLLAGLGSCIANFQGHTAPQISAIVLSLFSVVGISGSVGQLILLGMLQFDGPVVEVQKGLERLRRHRLAITQILMSSVPFYLAHVFFWFQLLFGIDLFASGDPQWLLAQMALSIALLPFAFWLIREMGKPMPRYAWIAGLRRSVAGERVEQAVQAVHDLEHFTDHK